MHPYSGISAALTTKHGKQEHIAEPLRELGITLSTVEYDTDLLGTFAGEIEREGTPLEVVRRKARIGMELARLPFGVASEGSFGPDHLIPFVNSNVELLIWIDDLRGIEIVESYRTLEVQAHRVEIQRLDQLESSLSDFDFPHHAVIAKGKSRGNSALFKGIADLDSLRSAITTILKSGDIAVIENDLRAHLNPQRQRAINEVAKRLVARLKELCVNCGTPGWGVVSLLKGLPCENCQHFNAEYPAGEIKGCARCEYQEEIKSEKKSVSPAECLSCNP